MVHISALKRAALSRLAQGAARPYNALTKLWLGYLAVAPRNVKAIDAEFSEITVRLAEVSLQRGGNSGFFRSRAPYPTSFDLSALRAARGLLSAEAVAAVAAILEDLLASSAILVTQRLQSGVMIAMLLGDAVPREALRTASSRLSADLLASPELFQTDRQLRRTLLRFLEELALLQLPCDRLVEAILDLAEAGTIPADAWLQPVQLCRYLAVTDDTAVARRVASLCCAAFRTRAAPFTALPPRSLRLIRTKLHSVTCSSDLVLKLAPVLAAILREVQDADLLVSISRNFRRAGTRASRAEASQAIEEGPTVVKDLVDAALSVPLPLERRAALYIPLIVLAGGQDISPEKFSECVDGLIAQPEQWTSPQLCSLACRFLVIAQQHAAAQRVSAAVTAIAGALPSATNENHLSTTFFLSWVMRVREMIPCGDAVKVLIENLSSPESITSVELLSLVIIALREIPDAMKATQRVAGALGRMREVTPRYSGHVVEAYMAALSIGVVSRPLARHIRSVYIGFYTELVQAGESSAKGDAATAVVQTPLPRREVERLLRTFPMMYRLNMRHIGEGPLFAMVAKASARAVAAHYSASALGNARAGDAQPPLPKRTLWLAVETYITLATHFVPGKQTKDHLAAVLRFLTVHRAHWRAGQLVSLGHTLTAALNRVNRLRSVDEAVRRRHRVCFRPLILFYLSVAAETIGGEGLSLVENRSQFATVSARIATQPAAIKDADAAVRAQIAVILRFALESMDDAAPREEGSSTNPMLVNMFAAAADINDHGLRMQLAHRLVAAVPGLPFRGLVQLSLALQDVLDPQGALLVELAGLKG